MRAVLILKGKGPSGLWTINCGPLLRQRHARTTCERSPGFTNGPLLLLVPLINILFLFMNVLLLFFHLVSLGPSQSIVAGKKSHTARGNLPLQGKIYAHQLSAIPTLAKCESYFG